MSDSFTRAEVAAHNTPNESIWIVISGEVYNITEFQTTHPGGAKILQIVAGKDATKSFKKLHNERILKTQQYIDLRIGTVKEDDTSAAQQKGRGIWGFLRQRKSDKTIVSG